MMKKVRKVILWLFVLGFLGILCCAAYVVVDDVTVELTDYRIKSDSLPLEFYGYRLMCVSDFHNASFYSQISSIINERKPDAVLFLGDMATMYDYEHYNLDLLLDAIDEDIPLYGVIGNHEYFSLSGPDEVVELLRNTRITMLDDEYVDLERDGAKIRLIGVRDVWITADEYQLGDMAIRFMREYITSAIEDCEYYTVLMAHRADLYPYLNDLGVNLMLAGHMHGGLVRLPRVGGVFTPNGGLLPDYESGIYQESGTTMAVSRGCDMDWKRPRVFNGPEIVQITLTR